MFDELCSAELLNQKHLVPCDPVGYLNKEYGKLRWYEPKPTNYTWNNLVYSGNWSDLEWKNVLKYYYSNGSLNEYYTLAMINSQLNNKIKKLPFEN